MAGAYINSRHAYINFRHAYINFRHAYACLKLMHAPAMNKCVYCLCICSTHMIDRDRGCCYDSIMPTGQSDYFHVLEVLI